MRIEKGALDHPFRSIDSFQGVPQMRGQSEEVSCWSVYRYELNVDIDIDVYIHM